MKLLGWWLMLVGSLRLASVWFGFFDIWALRLAVFSKTTKLGKIPNMSESLHSRNEAISRRNFYWKKLPMNSPEAFS
ncbi:unnamed protein product [Thlaspi arvense]|uniref:Secreted protein n=1 Tax=Thlaspi arvense TaxID=13288 RepID=A0AAU9RGW5_THLAR|nr:unnamed protein product [Thlaspi arvense]